VLFVFVLLVVCVAFRILRNEAFGFVLSVGLDCNWSDFNPLTPNDL
jgi:hypothetical protein